MSRRSIRLLTAGVVAALAIPAGLVATASVASAAPTCSSSEWPAGEGVQSSFAMACTTPAADLSSTSEIADHPNARYHTSAMRERVRVYGVRAEMLQHAANHAFSSCHVASKTDHEFTVPIAQRISSFGSLS